MPGMTGKELVEHWLQRRPKTKVLFTSGYTEDAVLHQNIVEQEINFIQKPYRAESLAIKMREVLG